MTDDFMDDAELDALIAEEKEADRNAAGLLREALGDARGAPAPADLPVAAERIRDGLARGGHAFGWIGAAADFGDSVPADDAELVVATLAATISPREDTGLDAEEEALLLTVERADWLGAVVELVRAGPGAPARPGDLVAAIHRCPEVEIGPAVDADDDAITEAGFELVTTAWHALGVLDDQDRLTPLGAWALPRGLARAWGADFDSG